MAEVESVEKDQSFFAIFQRPQEWKLRSGASIAINGVCSTVREFTTSSFEVEYMPETLKKTTVGNFQKGMVVNLEQSLRVGDEMGGHIVQGHVDTVGEVVCMKPEGEAAIIEIELPETWMKYIAPKGSIAVDGISLTVVDAKKTSFTVSLVSYTLEHTNLGSIKKGGKVNIEVDVLAKYVERLLVHIK